MKLAVHTEVLVVGAGAAGVAAAIACTRNGVKVIFAERNGYPGGKATAAEVGTICGLYQFSKKTGADYLVKGFAKDFAEKLRIASSTKPLSNNDGLHYLPYNIESFKTTCLSLLSEESIDLHFNSSLRSIQLSGDKLVAGCLQETDRELEVTFSAVIDCSGDSIVSQLAALPVIRSEEYQAAAQVFTMQDVEEDNEFRLGMIIIKAIRSAIGNNELEEFYDRIYIVQGSLIEKRVSFKVGIPVRVTNSADNLEELRTVAQQMIGRISEFLVSHVAAFKNASVEHIAPEVGTRVGFRSEGKYVLTEQDVLSGRKFPDAVANASWPIEEWVQEKRVHMRYLEPGDHYQVPAGCLQSKHAENLWMAGRDIAATDAAIASARVMGICLQTGYAAGLMAAAYVKGTGLAAAIQAIQNEQM